MDDPSWLQRIVSSPTRYGYKISSRILNILSKILNKRYQKVDDITENDLLEWRMWPDFLGMIGTVTSHRVDSNLVWFMCM